MSDLLSETLISFAAVGERIPGRGGRRLNPTTPFRWATKGARAADGTRVVLESVRVGGRTLTTAEAVRRFVDRLSALAAASPVPGAIRTPAERRQSSERAVKELEKMRA